MPFSDRERDVLAPLSQGRSNKEIARDLGMAEATVKVHMRAIMRKIGARNRSEVAIYANGNGHNPKPPDPRVRERWLLLRRMLDEMARIIDAEIHKA